MVDIRQLLGNTVDWVGGKVGIPETGISEWIAGGPTQNTSNPVYAAEGTNTDFANQDYNEAVKSIQNVSQDPANQPIVNSPTGGTSNNNSGSGFDISKYPGWDPNAAYQDWLRTGGPKASGGGDPYAQVRNDIESGYGSYFSNLNDQLNQLPGQMASQNQIIENSYGQGVSDLNLQQTQGEQQFAGQRGEIAGNQSKNLKSLDENLRNMFMAGNVYLGSRGAGDSSAGNQYSYALTKQGNQARGEQLQAATKAYSEVQARETNLKNTVANEMTKLKTNADNEKLKVGQWFADAQNQVKTAIANGQLSKSTDLANLSKSILDQAMTRLQSIQTNTTNLQNSLISWAENNATSIGQLKTNLQSILSVAPSLAGASTVNGTPTVDSQGNYSLQGLGTGTSTQKKDIFGNIIQ